MAVVKLLMVEPISKVPADMRFSRSLSSALTGLFGSKSGSDAMASTSPVLTLRMTAPAAIAWYFSIDRASSSCTMCWTRMSIDSLTGLRSAATASPDACRSARPWSSMYFSMPAMPWLSMLVRPRMCDAVTPPG